jgi:hypothetical protein
VHVTVASVDSTVRSRGVVDPCPLDTVYAKETSVATLLQIASVSGPVTDTSGLGRTVMVTVSVSEAAQSAAAPEVAVTVRDSGQVSASALVQDTATDWPEAALRAGRADIKCAVSPGKHV